MEAGGAEVFAGGGSGGAAAGAFDEGAVGQGLAHCARGCGGGWLWWRGVPRGVAVAVGAGEGGWWVCLGGAEAGGDDRADRGADRVWQRPGSDDVL